MFQVKGSIFYYLREMSFFVFESFLIKVVKGVFLMVKKEFIIVNKNLILECYVQLLFNVGIEDCFESMVIVLC